MVKSCEGTGLPFKALIPYTGERVLGTFMVGRSSRCHLKQVISNINNGIK